MPKTSQVFLIKGTTLRPVRDGKIRKLEENFDKVFEKIL